MSEIEVPVEQIQEHIMEKAHQAKSHGGGHGDNDSSTNWFEWVALSSALLAVIAAVSALLAGHHANEAMIEQIQSSDRWSYYQAKGIKSAVLGSKVQLLKELGKNVQEEDLRKLEQYKTEQEEISVEAKEKEELSKSHMLTHGFFAKAVTFFQIAIAVSAISVLVRRRRFWLISLGFGVIGLVIFAQGFFGPLSGFH